MWIGASGENPGSSVVGNNLKIMRIEPGFLILIVNLSNLVIYILRVANFAVYVYFRMVLRYG